MSVHEDIEKLLSKLTDKQRELFDKNIEKHRGQVFILDIYNPISYEDPIHFQ